MSGKARERLAGVAAFSVLLALMVGGLAAGLGLFLTLPIAVAAAVALHLAIAP